MVCFLDGLQSLVSLFSVILSTVLAVRWPSRRLRRRRLFVNPLSGTEHGSPPSLTTRDRELVAVLEESSPVFEPETSDSAVRHSSNSTTGK